MIMGPPKIDKRTFSHLTETLLSMVPHYTPEWKAEERRRRHGPCEDPCLYHRNGDNAPQPGAPQESHSVS